MKNKGVIFSIIFILCVGVFLTNHTRRLVLSAESSAMTEAVPRSAPTLSGVPELFSMPTSVNSPEGKADAEIRNASGRSAGQTEDMREQQPEIAEDQLEEALPSSDVPDMQAAMAAEPMRAAESGGGAVNSVPASNVQEDEKTQQTENVSSQVLISPLTGSVETAGEKEAKPLTGSEDYKKRFQELDTRIKKMKDSGIEPNTDTYKNMADYEYRLWDKELNSVYCDILDRMESEEAEALRADEREWIKQRDQAAHKAISKYKGGTIESLEYIASMADSTRARAYELLEDYDEYLDVKLAIISNP